MGNAFSMLGANFWQTFVDFFTGIFALIPQYIYFFYTCIASVLDMLQFLLRKLAGLDSYAVNGKVVEGDILSDLLKSVIGVDGRYSALTSVFWSLVIFGAIVLVLGVIISIIRSHFNYDEKKSNPISIIGKALKSIATFAIVPLAAIFGVLITNILLQALDNMTASSGSRQITEVYRNSGASYSEVFKESEDEWGKPTYSSYDFFGAHSPTSNQTFSGMLFSAAAYDANRVRYGAYTAAKAGDAWSDLGIFNSNLSSEEEQVEDVASMIDYAFANNLSLKSRTHVSVLKAESISLVSSFKYLQSAVWYLGTVNFDNFSKYNVGLVWYYYNLWQFNFILGFFGIIVALTFMSSIVFGMIVRILECTALLLCLGPIVGMMPLDDGNGFKQWRKTFVGDVLMAIGAIVGMNLLFLLLPYLQQITFFEHKLLNVIMNFIIVIVGLISVKQTIGLISNFVGGNDANKVGEDIKKDVGKSMLPGAEKVSAAVLMGMKMAKFAVPGIGTAIDKTVGKVVEKIHKANVRKATNRRMEDGQARVSDATYAQLEQEHTQDLENQKEDAKNQAEQQQQEGIKEKNAANESYTKADKAKEKSGKAKDNVAKMEEEKKSVESEIEALKKAQEDLKKEEEEDLKDPHSTDEEKASRKDKIDNNEQLLSQLEAKASTLDLNISKEQVKADKFEKQAEKHEKEGEKHDQKAEEFFEKSDEFKKIETDLQKEIDRIAGGGNIPGFERRGHPIASNLAKIFSPTLKALGGVLGFDRAMEAFKKETKVLDNGKLAIREFAQVVMQQDLSKNKDFMTAKEKEDYEKAQLQEKATITTGVKEYNQVLRAVQELTAELKARKSNSGGPPSSPTGGGSSTP